MYRPCATVFALSILTGIPVASFAQNHGHSPVFNPLLGHPGLGHGKVTIDLPGKAHPAAAVPGVPQAGRALGRLGGPPGLNGAPPRLEGEAQINGSVKGRSMKVSGSLSEKGGSATGSSRRGAAGKPDIRHLPTCD